MELTVNSPVGFGLELDKELNHEGGKQSQAGRGTEFRDQLGQRIQLQLQRRGFGITSQG